MPPRRTASLAYQRKNSAAYATSLRASGGAFPFSSTMSRAKASARSVMKARRKISLPKRGLIPAQASCAWCATRRLSLPRPRCRRDLGDDLLGGRVHDRDHPVSVERLAAYDWAESTERFMVVLRGGGMCVSRQGLSSHGP